MAVWNRFFGNTASSAAGFAIGTAAGPTLAPIVEDVKAQAWKEHQSRRLSVATIAQGVAEGQIDRKWAEEEAKETGYSPARFDRLVALFDTGPGVAQAFTLWRRGSIDRDGFRRALKREGLEAEWIDALEDEHDVLLEPAQIALGIVRSLLADPGFLPVDLDTSGGKVPGYGVSPIDPVSEAGKRGITKERLRVMVGEIGLPMSLGAAAQAVFRGIIKRADFNRAVLEGDTRPEWADAILEQARQIPTARDFFENALRGYHDLAWALEQAKRHGMSEDDALTIYQNQGRPMAIRQITQALSRGAKFKPEPGEIADPYDAAVVEGNLKPAYYELAKALRYTLPSPFVMRQLTASGVWSQAKAAQRLKDSGWIPQDAEEAAAAWAAPGADASESPVKKADTQLWTTLHRSYVADETDDKTAATTLQSLGLDGAAQTAVLKRWKQERDLIRKQLTPAQIRTAYRKMVKNPSTGKPWTRDDALAALVARGYTLADAETFIDTPPGK